MKVVINSKIGGFSLNSKAFKRLIEIGYTPEEYEVKRLNESKDDDDESPWHHFYPDVERNDPRLVRVVEELGKDAHYKGGLKIVEIPADVEWYVDEDETGVESIHEKHRSWW